MTMPETVPAASQRQGTTWTRTENIKRTLWMFAWGLFFRASFHNWYGWRRFVLRCFGARIGSGVLLRPTVWVEIPWNLEIGDDCMIGDYVVLYSLGRITLGRGAVLSQYAHLCGGTHDHARREFTLLRCPIHIGEEAWVAADAFVGPGVTIGRRAIVGARATVVKDVASEQIVVGNPARVIGQRRLDE